MKKIATLILAMILAIGACLGLTACGDSEDVAYVKEKGKLVIGITDFAPMDYQLPDGSWTGFDAEVAKLFAQSLGVTAEFVEINWYNKVFELDNKNIDCVWNGMTLTDEVKNAMETSIAYCNNSQIVVVKKSVAANYQTIEACKNLNFAVEDGSAGEEQAAANGFTNVTEVEDQATALLEVARGTADAAIIDSLMAAAMVGEGTSYAQLAYTVKLNNELYGVGFRKGSGLAEELNDFFKENYETIKTLANTFKVQEALIDLSK